MPRMNRFVIAIFMFLGGLPAASQTNGLESPESEAAGEASSSGPSVNIEIGALSLGGPALSEIAWWGYGAQAYGAAEWLRGEFRAFEATHPGIAISEKDLANPIRLQKRLSMYLTLPRNIVGIDSWSGDEIVHLVERGDIVPIEDFLPDTEFSMDIFYDNLFDAVTYKGQRWAIPIVADPMFLVCNQDIFDAVGLADPPRTWEEYADYSRRMTRDTDGDGLVDQWGNGSLDYYFFAMWSLVRGVQEEVRMLTPTGVIVDQPGLREVLGALREYRWMGVSVNNTSAVHNDNVGMQLVSANRLNFIENNEKYFLAPVPTSGKPIYASYGRTYLAVRRASPEEMKASWELIKWISRPDVAMPQVWGGYPVRKDFIHRDDFKERTASGIRNLELLYTSVENSRDLPPHYLGRALGLRSMWLAISPYVFRKHHPPLEELLGRGEKLANGMIRPSPPLIERSVLFD